MLRRLILLVPILLAACSGGGDGGDAAAPTSTTQPPGLTATVDWDERTVSVRGATPFEVDFCEGEAPFLCVSLDGEVIGAVELATFDDFVDDFDVWAAELYDSVAEDRVVGCDPDYALDGDDPVEADFGGHTGVRYGFTGTVDGRAVERVVGYAVEDGGSLFLLVANTLADDGCLAREGELPVDAIDDFGPVLAALAKGSALPQRPEAALPDGTHSGFLVDFDRRGTITLDLAEMLNGDEAVAAAREDGELPPDGELPNDFYIDNDDTEAIELPVDQDATVELYDCSTGCELRAVATGDFMTGDVEPFNGDRAFVEIETEHGEVVALREVYYP